MHLSQGERLNPPASAGPRAACRGVSEQKGHGLFRLRIEDSPLLAAESLNGIHEAASSILASSTKYEGVKPWLNPFCYGYTQEIGELSREN